jgi:hypothetical protein
MMANKQQWCGIAGWTARQFDAAIIKGFPAQKRTSSRGDIWQVDTRDGIAWVVEQEAPKHRPKPRQAERDERQVPPDPPPGYRAIAGLENPVETGFMAAHLDAFYYLPRIVAPLAASLGIAMDKVHELTSMVVLAYADHVAQDAREVPLEPWASNAEPDIYDLFGFAPINWPNLAHKAGEAGEAGWEPPVYCCGWVEYSPEERAENIKPDIEDAAATADA